MTSSTIGEPTTAPPGQRAGGTNGSDAGSAGAGTTAPTLSDAALAALVESTTSGPTLAPPVTVAGATTGEAAATATWRTNVTIDALWSIDETRNAFMHVVGLGWRKVFNGRDGAFQALVLLASQARQTGRPCNLREEADGMIYEIYLW
jgi:hypothetical protein